MINVYSSLNPSLYPLKLIDILDERKYRTIPTHKNKAHKLKRSSALANTRIAQ